LSLSPEQIEYAEMLQRRAAGDLHVCQKLVDDIEVDDSIIGFHAQQAVEKALKVALVLAGIELPHTHDTAAPAARRRASTSLFHSSFQFERNQPERTTHNPNKHGQPART
jgi:HEPN domain-containing protein